MTGEEFILRSADYHALNGSGINKLDCGTDVDVARCDRSFWPVERSATGEHLHFEQVSKTAAAGRHRGPAWAADDPHSPTGLRVDGSTDTRRRRGGLRNLHASGQAIKVKVSFTDSTPRARSRATRTPRDVLRGVRPLSRGQRLGCAR